MLSVVLVATGARSAAHKGAHIASAVQPAARGVVCTAKPWTAGRPYFARTSLLNQPIAPAAAVDPNSPAMIGALARVGADRGFVLGVGAYTVPVYFAGPTTPKRSVLLTASFARGMAGKAPVLSPVPIPISAQPDPASDGHMAIVDPKAGCEYDFFQASKSSQGAWQAAWANSTSLAGSGIFRRLSPGARASGFALTAGLIFPIELRNGQINHALAIAVPNTRRGSPVPPATRSDGRTQAPEGIPMGARLRLDPTLDLSTLHLSPYKQTIARALQVYGAFVVDTGGSVSLYAVNRVAYRDDPYAGVLPSDKYISLDDIPLDRFQVLVPPPG